VRSFGEAYEQVDAAHPEGAAKLKFNEALKRVIDLLATDLIEATAQRVRAAGVETVVDIRHGPRRLAGFSEVLAAQNAELKRFLFSHVYNLPAITEDRDRSVRCLEELFTYYLGKPGSMPATYEELARAEARHVVVCDYIAGMTDQFLLRQHQEHFPVL
jgi:dGTPase